MKKILAWHFVAESRTLGYDANSLAVEPGFIYSIGKNETPEPCECGMHGSRRAIDALQFAPGPIICRVRIWGDVEEQDDKLVGRHREVLWMADATESLHRMACWSVRNTPLPDGRKVWDLITDQRSKRAVEVKESWLEGKATDAELAAAWDAAWAAARDAARDAAWAAAWDAAWAAAWAAQNTELERLLAALQVQP
jgi:hypothetical protein